MKRTAARVAGGVAALGLAGGAAWVAAGTGSGPGEPAPAAVPTGRAPVVRTDVAERSQFSGSLGHAGSYTVVAPAAGTLTGVAPTGRLVRQGQRLYEVDGRPVLLLYGQRPVWRPFASGMTDGADVRQLEAALKALGHGPDLTVDGHFSGATGRAVRRWQAAAHLPVTGTVPLGEVVFLPGAALISGHGAQLGTPVQAGAAVETATGDRRAVLVHVPPEGLANTRAGDPVMIILPDQHSRRAGTVTSIEVSQQTANVAIAVQGTVDGFLEQAQVQVFVTSGLHKDVLAVPIVSLRALPGGRYEVVAHDGAATRHVPVQVGLFDDITGLAEVSGAGLAAGTPVEVPSGDA